MRLLISFVVAVNFALGHAADASPRTDAEYVADKTMSLNTEGLPDMLTQPFVRFFRQELGKHAAYLKDEDRFAELIPDSVIVPWFDRTREIYIERLIEIEDADNLERYAAFLKSYDANTDHQTVDVELQSVAFGAGFNVLTSTVAVGSEIKAYLNTTTLADHPFLVEILETDGVFQFSNRILKKQLIAKVRNGS